MKNLILLFGVLCIAGGVAPYKEYVPIERSLRIHDIQHEVCRGSVCEVRDNEFM